ncbi:MAG: oligosaccharide flippase family protein, partial [Candidatus Ranarchaeia archaeon]
IVPLCIITLAYCIKARWIPGVYYNNSLMKAVYDFGIWNFLGSQVGFISGHIDKFIIGRWLGATSLGFYDKAMSIASEPPNSIIMNINAVMFSSFSKSKESKSDLKNYFKKSLVLSALMIFPIYVGLIVVAPYFVYTLLGEKWSPMILPFQVILFGFLFKSFGGLTQSFNVGVGKYKSHTLRRLLSLGIFSVCCILSVRFGITGIAVSFAVFSLSEIFLLMDLSRNILCLRWKDLISTVLPAVVSSTILLLSTVGTSLFILKNYTVTNMIFLVVLGAFSYVVYLFFDRSHVVVELKNSLLKDIFKPLLRTKNGTDQND